MNLLNRILSVVFQDRWINWGMIGVAVLLGVMLVVPSGLLADQTLSWVAVLLLAFSLLRSVYVGWSACRGKMPIEEPAETARCREQIGNYVFVAVFALMVVLALYKLIS